MPIITKIIFSQFFQIEKINSVYFLLGNTCREECTKVNVIPNRKPPAKKPEEELFLLRCKKRVLQTDIVEHTLEIELKAPRNYRPLPKPGPTPPIIEIPFIPIAGKNEKSKKIKKKKKKKK